MTRTMTEHEPRLRSITGRRIVAAFAAVLVLFGVALAVELVTLHRIADAEADVARLDHAKHAGHMAAAQVREQYIHQAHTLIEFGPGHLEHYARVVAATMQKTNMHLCFPFTAMTPLLTVTKHFMSVSKAL